MRRRDVLTGLCALGLSGPAKASALDRLAAAFAAEGFNGTIAAGRQGALTYAKAIGLADAGKSETLRLETRFETGSVSKWIAAIVVLALCDENKLALDVPILTYLPDYRADTGAKLSLRHLMSHRSGVPNEIIAARKADPASRGIELEQMEAVRRYASGDLAFAPGTSWEYAHSNWLIVKAAAERASGETYAGLVTRLLTAPLRLKDSGLFHGDSRTVPGMAIGYARLLPTAEEKPSPLPDYMAMTGGFFSSAPDMLKLMQAVLGGRILSPQARKALLTIQSAEQHYALGGRIRTEPIGAEDREALWLDGSNGGFRMVARQVLADGHAVVVMNNASFDYMRLGALASAVLDAGYPARHN